LFVCSSEVIHPAEQPHEELDEEEDPNPCFNEDE
jgi:hypothetical protein